MGMKIKHVIVIGIVVAVLLAGYLLYPRNSSPNKPPPLENIGNLYKSYNVTGSGEIKVNISGKWRLAGILVTYIPEEIDSGYVKLISPTGVDIIDIGLKHREGITIPEKNGTFYNVNFYHFAGLCTIEYHIVGSGVVNIEVRYML